MRTIKKEGVIPSVFLAKGDRFTVEFYPSKGGKIPLYSSIVSKDMTINYHKVEYIEDEEGLKDGYVLTIGNKA